MRWRFDISTVAEWGRLGGVRVRVRGEMDGVFGGLVGKEGQIDNLPIAIIYTQFQDAWFRIVCASPRSDSSCS